MSGYKRLFHHYCYAFGVPLVAKERRESAQQSRASEDTPPFLRGRQHRKGRANRNGISYIYTMDTQITSLAVIQAMLAPGLGISAVGLLLLGMSNRYGSIIARIRALNNEKRGFLKLMAQGRTLEYGDNVRYQSVVRQTESLLQRTRFVRNGILSMQSGIGLFVLTSLCIGVSVFVESQTLQSVSLVVFLAGMIAVLVGIVFAGLDVSRSFRVVELEVHTDD